MSTHTLGSFNEAHAVMHLALVLESQHTIKTFFSVNDKTPNYDGCLELVGSDAAPKKQFIVQIKKTENLRPNVAGAHKGCYAYEMETPFLHYVDARVSESPAIYFVVDIAQQRIFWLYLSAETLDSLNFRGRSKVTCWFTEEDILSDVAEFTGKLDEITEIRNAMLDALDEEKAKEEAWQYFVRHKVLTNPEITFDNYFVSPENQMTVQTLRAVVRDPGNAAYNPIYLYGPWGTGKTHLVNAMVNALLAARPNVRVRYLTAESFVNELIEAIRAGEIDIFHRAYNACDVLVIDDIQFIAGKEHSQEDLYYRIEALCRRGKQVIITSSHPLKDFPTLAEHLHASFGMGLSLELVLPDYDTRLKIVRWHCRQLGLDMDDDVAEYIARYPFDNTRYLVGVVRKIWAYHQLAKLPVTRELVEREAAAVLLPKTPDKNKILEAVCNYYGVDTWDMISTSRTRHIVQARQVAMYLMRQLTNLPLHEISRAFERDHSVVLHSLRKVEAQLKAGDEGLREALQQIRNEIKKLP